MRKIGEMRMLKLFTPDYYIHSFSALRPEYLLEHGIRLLVCDIDNTLVPHDVALPDEKAVQFIRGMQEAGILSLIHIIQIQSLRTSVRTMIMRSHSQKNLYYTVRYLKSIIRDKAK